MIDSSQIKIEQNDLKLLDKHYPDKHGPIKRFISKMFAGSMWFYPYISSCCFEEYKSIFLSDYKIDKDFKIRLCTDPKQADVLLIGGPLTLKQLEGLLKIYDEMNSPKWVILLGSCAISGGAYNSYSVISDIASHIKIDVTVPGCPPGRESILLGFLQLREKIKRAYF